jgi:hypothetical protein
LINNIEKTLKEEIKNIFVESYLCGHNENVINNWSIPLHEIDIYGLLELDELKFKRKYGNTLNNALWDVVNTGNSVSVLGLTINLTSNLIIDNVNYPNVLSIQGNVTDTYDFLIEFLDSLKLFDEASIYEDLISINLDKLSDKQRAAINNVEVLKKIQNDYIDNSYYTLSNERNGIFNSVQQLKKYADTSVVDDYNEIYDNLNDYENSSNIFTVLAESLNSSSLTDDIHVIKQVFEKLTLSLSMNIMTPSFMLLYRFFEKNAPIGETSDEVFRNSRTFIKKIIFNVIEKTIITFLLYIIISEISGLVVTSKIKNIQEKINLYLLQYRSLLKIN